MQQLKGVNNPRGNRASCNVFNGEKFNRKLCLNAHNGLKKQTWTKTAGSFHVVVSTAFIIENS